MLLRFSLHHTLKHAMHVANSRSKDVNPGCLNELSRFLRRRKVFEVSLSGLMDFGAGPYVAYFPFRKDCGVDRLDRLNRFPRAGHILIEGQRGKIDPHCVKARICRLQGLLQRMCMVSVQEGWHPGFLAQTPHQSGKLASTKKVPLSFGGTDQHWKLRLSCGCNHRLKQDKIGNIEMTKGRASLFQPCQ